MSMQDDSTLERRRAFASAALRHVRDAVHLLDSAGGYISPDQAFHLAGYGPECARKAALAFGWFDKLLGHRIRSATEPVIDLATGFDPGACRYDLQGWTARHPRLSVWTETCRYEKTGERSEQQARDIVSEAREVVDTIVLALWMDGLLPARVA